MFPSCEGKFAVSGLGTPKLFLSTLALWLLQFLKLTPGLILLGATCHGL
jgi:hypothetical protein